METPGTTENTVEETTTKELEEVGNTTKMPGTMETMVEAETNVGGDGIRGGGGGRG